MKTGSVSCRKGKADSKQAVRQTAALIEIDAYSSMVQGNKFRA